MASHDDEPAPWLVRLEQLIRSPPPGYSFRLGSPCPFWDIIQLERDLGVGLEEGYRAFLARIGAVEIRRDGELRQVWFGTAADPALRVQEQSLALRGRDLHRDFRKIVVVGASLEGYEELGCLEDYQLFDGSYFFSERVLGLTSSRTALRERNHVTRFSESVVLSLGDAAQDLLPAGTYVTSEQRIREIEAKAMAKLADKGARQRRIHADSGEADDGGPSAIESVIAMNLEEQTRRVLRAMTPREEEVMRKRFAGIVRRGPERYRTSAEPARFYELTLIEWEDRVELRACHGEAGGEGRTGSRWYPSLADAERAWARRVRDKTRAGYVLVASM